MNNIKCTQNWKLLEVQFWDYIPYFFVWPAGRPLLLTEMNNIYSKLKTFGSLFNSETKFIYLFILKYAIVLLYYFYFIIFLFYYFFYCL